jgi:hypothetical protein
VVRFGETLADPLAKGRRTHAYIHGDIHNLPRQNLDQLALGLRMLEMQAPQNAFAGKGGVVLHEGPRNAGVFVAGAPPCL